MSYQKQKAEIESLRVQLTEFKKIETSLKEKTTLLNSMQSELKQLESQKQQFKEGAAKFNGLLKGYEELEERFNALSKKLKASETEKSQIENSLKVVQSNLKKVQGSLKERSKIINFLRTPAAAFSLFVLLTLFQIPITASVIVGDNWTWVQMFWAILGASVLEASTMVLILNKRKPAAFAAMFSMVVVGFQFFEVVFYPPFTLAIVVFWIVIIIHEFAQLADNQKEVVFSS